MQNRSFGSRQRDGFSWVKFMRGERTQEELERVCQRLSVLISDESLTTEHTVSRNELLKQFSDACPPNNTPCETHEKVNKANDLFVVSVASNDDVNAISTNEQLEIAVEPNRAISVASIATENDVISILNTIPVSSVSINEKYWLDSDTIDTEPSETVVRTETTITNFAPSENIIQTETPVDTQNVMPVEPVAIENRVNANLNTQIGSSESEVLTETSIVANGERTLAIDTVLIETDSVVTENLPLQDESCPANSNWRWSQIYSNLLDDPVGKAMPVEPVANENRINAILDKHIVLPENVVLTETSVVTNVERSLFIDIVPTKTGSIASENLPLQNERSTANLNWSQICSNENLVNAILDTHIAPPESVVLAETPVVTNVERTLSIDSVLNETISVVNENLPLLVEGNPANSNWRQICSNMFNQAVIKVMNVVHFLNNPEEFAVRCLSSKDLRQQTIFFVVLIFSSMIHVYSRLE